MLSHAWEKVCLTWKQGHDLVVKLSEWYISHSIACMGSRWLVRYWHRALVKLFESDFIWHLWQHRKTHHWKRAATVLCGGAVLVWLLPMLSHEAPTNRHKNVIIITILVTINKSFLTSTAYKCKGTPEGVPFVRGQACYCWLASLCLYFIDMRMHNKNKRFQCLFCLFVVFVWMWCFVAQF